MFYLVIHFARSSAFLISFLLSRGCIIDYYHTVYLYYHYLLKNSFFQCNWNFGTTIGLYCTFMVNLLILAQKYWIFDWVDLFFKYFIDSWFDCWSKVRFFRPWFLSSLHWLVSKDTSLCLVCAYLEFSYSCLEYSFWVEYLNSGG